MLLKCIFTPRILQLKARMVILFVAIVKIQASILLAIALGGFPCVVPRVSPVGMRRGTENDLTYLRRYQQCSIIYEVTRRVLITWHRLAAIHNISTKLIGFLI